MCRFSPLLLASLLLAAPHVLLAKCGDDPGDAVALSDAAAQVASDCDCAALTHGAYVSCALHVARERARAGTLPRQCTGTVARCAARSTCGRPGSVTCCGENQHGATCRIAPSASSCRAHGGTPGECASCCDTCATTCSTTTTLPACGNGLYPECNGTCPEGKGCTAFRAGGAVIGCLCVAEPACGGSFPECNGNCPPQALHGCQPLFNESRCYCGS
jgi:hypothetical protein